MIIDCHGHYTTAPAALQEFRDAQLARLKDPSLPAPPALEISDDEIRATIEGNQLRIARERGHDLTIFSPRATAAIRRDDLTEEKIAAIPLLGALRSGHD